MIGTSFGANAMGRSTGTPQYWQSREKWTLTQFFNRKGYTATKMGWKNDVYQLAKNQHEVYEGKGNSECLFTKINCVHTLYLKEREALETETERLSKYLEYQHEILRIRAEHIVKLNSVIKYMEESEWLIYVPPREAIVGWFDRVENLRWKMAIIFVLMICF